MPDIYRHNTVKFADSGINLRVPVDLVPPTQYSRLTNAIPLIEGQLQTRAGLSRIADIPFDGLSVLPGVTYSTLHASSGNPVVNPIYIRLSVTTASGEVAVSALVGPQESGDSVYCEIHIPVYLGATNWTAYFGYSIDNLPFMQTWTEATVSGFGRLVVVNSLSASARPTSPIHTIFRLNQQTTAISPERLIGIGNTIFSQQLPTGVFSPLSDVGYDGNPLTVIPFRFDSDPSSWAIISNANQMKKRRRPDQYVALGQVAPTDAATYSVGAAGAVTGNAYDWRYTYVNPVVNTESNPSPINVGTNATQRPTTNTTPDPVSGGSACSNPANAYDGNAATFAGFVGNSNTAISQSARFFGWGGIGTVGGLVLNIDSEIDVTGTTGSAVVSLFYSTDNGSTWSTVYSTSASRPRQTDTIQLPLGTDLTQLIVRAVASGTGSGGGDSGGGGGGLPCPLSGAPVKLYGEPEWWGMQVEPQEEFIQLTTETGRIGWFSPKDRRYCDRGLVPVEQWIAGMFAIIDEPEMHLERIVSVERVFFPKATVDHYEAIQGHVYSAWGFVGHNMKIEQEIGPN